MYPNAAAAVAARHPVSSVTINMIKNRSSSVSVVAVDESWGEVVQELLMLMNKKIFFRSVKERGR